MAAVMDIDDVSKKVKVKMLICEVRCGCWKVTSSSLARSPVAGFKWKKISPLISSWAQEVLQQEDR